MAENQLIAALEGIRRRALAIGVAGGAGWAAAAVLALLMLFAWADLALDLSPQARLACLCIALPCGAALLARAAWQTMRGASPRSAARRMDLATNTGGQILSGIDLLQQYRGAIAVRSLPGQLAQMAVARAAQLAARVEAARAVPAKPLVWPMASLGTLLLAVGVIAVAAPRLLATQWARFTDPFGDHPPYSNIVINVQPGDTRVVYGSALDVHATVEGGAVDSMQLCFTPDGASMESAPMFPEPGGAWRATVSQVTAGGVYFVQAGASRSHRFQYGLITVPELRDVRVRITPPAYTHLPPYSGPAPQRGIAGLPGTQVEFWVTSNRPLQSGAITLTGADASPAAPSTPANAGPIALAPTQAGADQVTGSMTITRAGELSVSITDTAGQPCREPYKTSVTVLKDERPFVRILEPKENAFATPDAKLEVNLAAEDDYGISSLQLFRGLNQSRATPASVPVPANQPTRLSASIPFDLSEYGLSPGDEIKFYARVEDNDPAGAKGSESPVVTLHIISNEDFNRLAVAREGLQTLEAKYAMADRRLESLDSQLGKLLDELKKADANSPLAKEKREQIQKLAKEMRESADEVAAAAADDLPFDADKEFRKQLDEIARSMKEAAGETDEAAGEELSSGKAGEKLTAARQKLAARRGEFRKQVVQPLENLDKIFPLIEDQERFVEIWQRQQDLAERMKSLTSGAPDDPKLKSRMRDLETEQRQLVRDLDELLNDIRDHAVRLPIVSRPLVRGNAAPPLPLAAMSLHAALSAVVTAADEAPAPDKDDEKLKDDLEQLQQTAFDFVMKVRNSGAFEQMNESAADLGAFDGAHAAVKAQEAADTLKKFIGQCKANQAKMRGMFSLIFRPSICQSMDATVDQLLSAEGMNPGGGVGAGGGFSQRRSTMRNTSLYGRIPSRQRGGGQRSSKQADGPLAGGRPDGGGDREPIGQVDVSRLHASGEADVAVPPQYKRKVGEYFQRVADELGQD